MISFFPCVVMAAAMVMPASEPPREVRAGWLHRAAEIAPKIEGGTENRFFTLLELLAAQEAAGEKAEAAATAEACKGLARGPRQEMMTAAIVGVKAMGDVAAARAEAEGIESLPLRAEVLSRIAEMQVMKGDASGGKETALSVRDDAARVGVYIQMAQAQVAIKDPGGARETLAGAKKLLANAKAPGSDDSSKVCELAIGMARAGDFAEATTTASTINEEFSSVREKAFIQVMIEALRQGDVAAAKAAGVACPAAARSGEVLGWSAAEQARAGGIRDAKREIDEIQSDVERARGLARLAVALIVKGDVQGAKETVAEALKLMREKGQDERSLPRFIAIALAKCGDAAGAMDVIREMKIPGQRGVAQATVAKIQAAAGDFDGAMATLKACEHPVARAQAFESFGAEAAARGDAAKVDEWVSGLDSPFDQVFALLGASGWGMSNAMSKIDARLADEP